MSYGKTRVGHSYIEERDAQGRLKALAELEYWCTSRELKTKSGKPIWRRHYTVRYYTRTLP